MAKKNKGNFDVYTNALTGRSKEDIICEFAYSLVTADKSSEKADTRKTLFGLWKNGDYSEYRLSDKQIRRYSSRGIMTSDMFSRIASVLKAALQDEELMGAVIARVLMDFSAYLSAMMRGGNADTGEEQGIWFYLEAKQHINWARVRADWSPAIAYIRTFGSKKVFMRQLEERDAQIGGFYKDLIDAVFDENSVMLWFIDRSNDKEDKQLIAQYTNQSEFYKLCIKLIYDRLRCIQSTFRFAASDAEYGAYRGYAVAGLAQDTDGMRSGYEQIRADETETSALNKMQPDKDAIVPPDDAYIDHWTAQEALKVSYEYARAGIDVMAACRSADLTRKEIADIIKEAFLEYESWTNVTSGYSSKRDREAVTKLIVDLWMSRCLGKAVSTLCVPKNDTPKEETVKIKKTAAELKKENESLKRKVAKLSEELESESRNAKDRNKGFMAEIAAAKAELKEQNKVIEDKESEIEELKMLLDMEGSENTEEETAEESGFGEAEFRGYINEHKVLVWGFREETERKFKEMFPELSFVSSDRRLTRQQLTAYDAVLMATNYTGHGHFWAARDSVKAAAKPMAYLDKTANTPDKLYKALSIAIGVRKR